ncbi:hypothetical protein C0W44_06750 [Photobacterium leiognathi subsp. mandapamensis]|nr:hypothetical protein C0W44_06750 [Photobacterium leiognathi subsp. mandapamensis]
MIYHYTSVDTLLKILESQSLWASDLSKMNDPQEFTAGLEILRDLFSETFPDSIDWFNHNQIVGSNNQQLLLGCSFSNMSDDLSQWRAYGDDGCGVVIGVDESILRSHNSMTLPRFYIEDEKPTSYVHLFNVIYTKQELVAKANDLFSSAGDFTNDRVDSLGLSLGISRLACSYKADFYHSESEVRAIIEHSKRSELYLEEDLKSKQTLDLKFRTSKYGLISYCNLMLGPQENTAIKQIVLGPKCNVTSEELRFMLMATGYGDVSIDKSKGSYR